MDSSSPRKRNQSGATLDANDDVRREARGSRVLPMEATMDSGQLFLYTNNDSCIAMQRDKLLRLAPNSWFARLLTNREPGDTCGDTQETPLRVSLPTWFVQDVADWTQPMSTQRVYFGRCDAAVREMLQTIGWSEVGGDLPVAFSGPDGSDKNVPARSSVSVLYSMFGAFLSSRTMQAIGAEASPGKVERHVFWSRKAGERPNVRAEHIHEIPLYELDALYDVANIRKSQSIGQHEVTIVTERGVVHAIFFSCAPGSITSPVGIVLNVMRTE